MEKSALDLAADRIYKRLEQLGGNPELLPSSAQPIAILYTVQAIIDNGGFRYLFESDMPFTPPYSVISNAYRTIGATGPAEALDKAVSLFPFAQPEKDEQARNEFMNSLDESDQLFALGDQLCGDESVWQLLDHYVQTHPEASNVGTAPERA
jgi:hypothetical protein